MFTFNVDVLLIWLTENWSENYHEKIFPARLAVQAVQQTPGTYAMPILSAKRRTITHLFVFGLTRFLELWTHYSLKQWRSQGGSRLWEFVSLCPLYYFVAEKINFFYQLIMFKYKIVCLFDWTPPLNTGLASLLHSRKLSRFMYLGIHRSTLYTNLARLCFESSWKLTGGAVFIK